MRTMTQ
jgi:hypothetical protein